MVENKYKVPKKLWNQFKAGQQIFNDVMEQSLLNQSITKPPKMPELSKEFWEVLCWNFACYAAWASIEEPLRAGETVQDIMGDKTIIEHIVQ